MANMKLVAMIDAVARETRAQNLSDIKTALQVVEDEINHLQRYADALKYRIEVLEGATPH